MSPESIRQQLEEEAEDILMVELNACKHDVEETLLGWMKKHEESEAAKYLQMHTQMSDIQKQIAELQNLFEQGKTTIAVLKYVGYAGAGIWAMLVWGKDHLKL